MDHVRVRTPIPLVPILQVRPFAVHEALARGVPRGRLYAADLARPFYGVRTAVAPQNLIDRMRAYSERMSANEFFSHVTSALHLGIPLPQRLEQQQELHVSVIAPAYSPRARGVIGHEVKHAQVVNWRGFPIADAATTWCQLAGLLPLADLVAVGDYLLTGPDPVHGIPAFLHAEDLSRAVREHAHGRGIRNARRALDLVREGPRSRPESLLRVLMVTSGLPEPELNLPVRLADGSKKQPDIAYPAIRFGLEYEGDGHRTDRSRFLADIDRKEAFADINWEIMRVTTAHLQHPVELIERIQRRIRRRCLALGVPIEAHEN